MAASSTLNITERKDITKRWEVSSVICHLAILGARERFRLEQLKHQLTVLDGMRTQCNIRVCVYVRG
jgi:hypothetical protein